MSKQPALTVGTKPAFTPTKGTKIGETIKAGANLIADEQRPLLATVAAQLTSGAAHGKAHAYRR